MRAFPIMLLVITGVLWQTNAWAVAPNNFFRKNMEYFFLEGENAKPPFEVRYDFGRLREELNEKLGLSGTKKKRLPIKRHFYGKSEADEVCHVHISARLQEVKVSILNSHREQALEFTFHTENVNAAHAGPGQTVYGAEGRGIIRWEESLAGRRMTWVEGRFPEYIKIDQLELVNGQRRALNLYCGNLKTYRSIFDRFLPEVEPPLSFGGGNDPLGQATR